MPPVPPSSGVLRDRSNAAAPVTSAGGVFKMDRAAAKSALLKSLPPALAEAPAARGTKLLEALGSMRLSVAAAGDAAAAGASKPKLGGGARRVVAASAIPSAGGAPSALPTVAAAAPAAPLPSVAAVLAAPPPDWILERDALQSELSALKAKLAAVEAERVALESACIGTQEALEGAREQLAQAAARNAQLQSTVTQQAEEIAALKTQLTDATAAVAAATAAAAAAAASVVPAAATSAADAMHEDHSASTISAPSQPEAEEDEEDLVSFKAEPEPAQQAEAEQQQQQELQQPAAVESFVAVVEATEAEQQEAASELDTTAAAPLALSPAKMQAESAPAAVASASPAQPASALASFVSEEAAPVALVEAVSSAPLEAPALEEEDPAGAAAATAAAGVDTSFAAAPAVGAMPEAELAQMMDASLEGQSGLLDDGEAAEEEVAPLASAGAAGRLSAGGSGAALGANDSISAHSINLSLSSHAGSSPLQPLQLPASFLSPGELDDSRREGLGLGPQGALLSPIARSTPLRSSAGGVGLLSPVPAASQVPSAALSASALKIQALFRGRMERAYLGGGDEQRLSQLHVTAPSTPGAAAAATPSAKRQRRTGSALKLPAASSALAAAEPSPARELSFQCEEAEEEVAAEEQAEEEAAGEDAQDEDEPLALQAKSKQPNPYGLSGLPSAASTTAASAAPAAPLAPLDAKRLHAELKAARAPLANLDACWTLRSKSLNRIEELARERGAGGMASWAGWKEELLALQRPLLAQLADLRSSILRECCRTLIALCDASPRDFEEQLAVYAPQLCRSLYVTIKVISTTADETLAELVTRCASAKSVPLLLAGLGDAHAVVREKCALYLVSLLSTARAADTEASLPALLAALPQGLQDSDARARAAWRLAFAAARRLFSAPLDALFESLPPAAQKAIEAERKQRGAKQTTMKRKK